MLYQIKFDSYYINVDTGWIKAREAKTLPYKIIDDIVYYLGDYTTPWHNYRDWIVLL